jgi:pimeloyl-ACP methyl ester carboxylesterase
VIEQPDLDGVRHRTVDAGGVELHVAEMGDPQAPPLLLVHGWPQHWWCWRKVAPDLARDFRCVMADMRGFGWSEKPAQGYDKETLAADLAALLDALELERVGVVGHDWGGWCSFILAGREPERVSALLAVSIGHPWPSRHDRRSPLRVASLSYQIPLVTPLVAPRFMRSGATRQILLRAAPKGTYTERDLELFDAPMRSPEGVRTTTSVYRSFLMQDVPKLLRGEYKKLTVEQPARLVVGSKDIVFAGSDLLGFEENAPNLELHRVEGVGHFLPEERPELVVEHARELFGAHAA